MGVRQRVLNISSVFSVKMRLAEVGITGLLSCSHPFRHTADTGNISDINKFNDNKFTSMYRCKFLWHLGSGWVYSTSFLLADMQARAQIWPGYLPCFIGRDWTDYGPGLSINCRIFMPTSNSPDNTRYHSVIVMTLPPTPPPALVAQGHAQTTE